METQQEQEAKTPAPMNATTQNEDWMESFNERAQEEIELSIKSANEFSQELERARAAMKNKRQ